eukprot:CAMPEP_0202959952 /NCGR_PEP_ID=MMETSP1396-20130829/4148_1 /ASSEMBLY_ACC=CAM_ASM_000872 /TAXON_ID= /ORGANISM="Pseudokeronopsis sp., Strain Brazil" /LENGTH=144 /DNA_ID=CAMNT_0049678869 /DNA_START=44 /DNA_END=478 /DNA_ORIENTATION=-
MSDKFEGTISLEEGLKIVDTDYVKRVINYLETRQMEQSHSNYIKCYSMVLKLCDENDKAKDLNDYFRNTLLAHISQRIVPTLKKLRDDSLLKEFVRQWQNYTILVHFMRKMFNYLDRYYLKNTNMQTLAMSSLQFFKDNCFASL